MNGLRNTFTALTFAAAGLANANAAMAAHAIIYNPQVEAITGSSTGNNAADTRIINGSVITNNATAGAGNSASGNGTQVAASSFANGQTNAQVPLSNQTFASANLATGIFKATTASSGPEVFGWPLGYAQAHMQDTIYFTNTSGSAQLATLTYSFDGHITTPFGGNHGGNLGFDVSCAFSYCFNSVNEAILFANGPTRVVNDGMNYYFTGNSGYFGENIFGGQGSAPYFETHLNAPVGSIVDGYIRTTILVPTGETSLGLRAFLNLDCRQASSCDFGNTGTFSFSPLPGGLSFTSASGSFLTASSSGVPEPASWAMMLLGFGLIGAVQRRKPRSARLAA